jgi:ribonuclease P protein component
MLAKKFRLQAQAFGRPETGKKIKTLRSEYFTVKSRPNNLGFSRFGTVISRKVLRSAAKRNKIKRVIFNFIRLNKLHLKAPGQNKFATGQTGKDILIIVSPEIAPLAKNEIEEKLKSLVNSQ